ncbi:rRNA maturation RNase YbeY [Sediminitomix flava]|uniref:Endoribonuclease YbeY n=1 Tax=Sediminitomix flava TaxID=379075 RepID=A0A315Z033_SEDFL|nr:rRNA maturation RNase YbeY [Sediminitomix flava]PWJ35988.1 rRNA maturation RNase YbeY [Sediminitomix flava]
MAEINFFTEQIDFELEDKEKVVEWITQTFEAYDKAVGEINYIFCSDEYLYDINVEYLNHDTYTDIITFDNSEPDSNKVDSDIFVSIDRIKDNANKFETSFKDELHRVIIHGVLHLCGLKDKTEEDALEMRTSEQKHLALRGF